MTDRSWPLGAVPGFRKTRSRSDCSSCRRSARVSTPNQQSYATYTYNSDGLVSTITDANKNMTTLGYDGFDRLSVQEFPSKSTQNTSDSSDEEQYTYDNDNNMITRITRDGQTIQYQYDALNRMDEKIAPGEQTVYYGYTLQNQRMYANFASQTGQGVSDTYDGFGDLTSETVDLSSTAQTMAYQYDADGDRTRATYPDLNYVTYAYDGLDRLSQVLESGSTVLATYSYNAAGELTGVARGGGSPATTFGYDAIARLSSLSQTLATPADNVAFSYQYNPADQLVSDNISNAAYYPLVNGATQSYAPNGLNEYSTVGGTTYLYDGRGNLTSDGTTSYAYDVENRLTEATGWKLNYDPLGRLYSVTNTAGTTTTFIYDGDRITAEYDGSGNLLQRYVYGGGGDDPIVWYEGSGFGAANRQYFLANRQGSIIDVTDSNGNALAVNQYHPYGLGGSTNEGRFQFTGQAYIPEIGLYYYKARMYNPSLGRFMQTDPIGYKSDLDLYAYVGNDPLDRTDPTCLADIVLGLDADIFIGGGIELAGSVSFDTSNLEVGAEGTFGIGGGVSTGVGIIASVSPSAPGPARSSASTSMSLDGSVNVGPVGISKNVPITENGRSVIGQAGKTSGAATKDVALPKMVEGLKPQFKVGASVAVDFSATKTSDVLAKAVANIKLAIKQSLSQISREVRSESCVEKGRCN